MSAPATPHRLGSDNSAAPGLCEVCQVWHTGEGWGPLGSAAGRVRSVSTQAQIHF